MINLQSLNKRSLALILVCALLIAAATLLLTRKSNKGVYINNQGDITLASQNPSMDPILMYEKGITALRSHHDADAYYWFLRSSRGLKIWAEIARGRGGEARFNERYLVSDIYKILDEVNTNIPLIRSQLSDDEASQIERRIEEK